MIRYYKTVSGKITQIDEFQQNCWVQMIDPTKEEIEEISELTAADDDFLEAALDRQEISRTETDKNSGCSLIAINSPILPKEDAPLLYQTIPLGIIHTQLCVITVCLEDIPELGEFASGEVKNVFINLKTRFILEIINKVISSYVKTLRVINGISNKVEKQLHKSSNNKNLFDMLDLEKSTVFFSTGLNSNKVVIDRLAKGRVIQLFPDDEELMEDIQVEVEQAVSMCTIYSNILSGTMDAFASIISNNLNIVMKILTIMTIIISIPTSIFSLYGMNVPLPMKNFGLILLLATILTIVTAGIVWMIDKHTNLH